MVASGFRVGAQPALRLAQRLRAQGDVSKKYGAYDYAGGVSKRALFLIDESQTIAWSYLSPVALNPGVDGVLDALDALDSPAS